MKNFLFAGLLLPTGADYEVPISWTLEGHVKGPAQVLEDFGIDVYANPDFESWVPQQLW